MRNKSISKDWAELGKYLAKGMDEVVEKYETIRNEESRIKTERSETIGGSCETGRRARNAERSYRSIQEKTIPDEEKTMRYKISEWILAFIKKMLGIRTPSGHDFDYMWRNRK